MEHTINHLESLRGIDAGIRVVKNSRKFLIALTLASFGAQLSIALVSLLVPFSLANVFLFATIKLAALAWIVSASAMYSIAICRGRPESITAVLTKSFQFLPKVFFSYIGPVFGLINSMFAPPLLFLTVFFIWAPFLCIAETFIPRKVSEDDEEYAEYEEEPESSSRSIYWIKEKGLLDLGYARSVHLVGANIKVSMLMMLISWASIVIPQSLLVALSPAAGGGWLSALVQMFILGLSSVVVSMIFGTALLACLPASGREELEVIPSWNQIYQFDSRESAEALSEPLEKGSSRSASSFENNGFKIAALILLAMLSTAYLFTEVLELHTPPNSLSSSIESVEWAHQRLLLKVRFEDSERRFQWFTSVRGWELRPIAAQADVAKPSEKNDAQTPESESIKKEALVPAIVKMLDAKGNEVVIDHTTEFDESAIILFYFDVPDSLQQSQVRLVHLSRFGEESNVLTFRVPEKVFEQQ